LGSEFSDFLKKAKKKIGQRGTPWGVKFEPILLIFFHPIFLSESEFSEF
jgi:hypothetical protein